MSAAGDLAAFDRFADLSVGDDHNFQWRVANKPVGNVAHDDFEWSESDIPEPAEGEVLLKTHYLGLAPVMRFYMQGTGAAGEAALQPGDVIHGLGVAQVVKSRHSDWREGEVIQGQIGWQPYKISKMSAQEKFFRMPHKDLPAALGTSDLGMTGLSAYVGFFARSDPRPEDKMVLSGAAGGVGSIVSQIAVNVVGCDVVGIAVGAKKCAFIQTHGCSAVIDYNTQDIGEMLDQLRPDGIDLYFDNVGGETLGACIERLRMHARIVLCGSISEYTRDVLFKLSNYTRLRSTDSRMQGFFVYNHLGFWEAAMDDLAGLVRDGRLKPVQNTEQGFQNMPRALANLYYGANTGKQCCSFRGEPNEWL